MAWLRISVFFIAIVYLWIYPSMLLVPVDYRDSFWSLDYNIPQKGIVVSREAYHIEALFNKHTVYKVEILSDGQQKYFWVANHSVGKQLIDNEMVRFESRGDVIVLAEIVKYSPSSISRLN
ncbi:hypothetical protein SPFL3102_03210 [Sporomusaceae bacterium FL31]|nr:hypothetical protein SPFL3101_03862 [Sporomusaceae bacterium FL31]GCE35374.1 hypothetical protein SPFL3102_03210 [Sporomusaceae bacterium]